MLRPLRGWRTGASPAWPCRMEEWLRKVEAALAVLADGSSGAG